MQLALPIFPASTKMINNCVGFRSENGFVYYMLNGQNIYCHAENDRNSYRFILASLTKNNLCTKTELSTALGIRRKNIERYAKAYEENGVNYFFNREDNRGQCYRFTKEKQKEAQELLDSGVSQNSTAKKIGVSESAVRYHLRSGDLKKKKR
jgi:biotin operon repressor